MNAMENMIERVARAMAENAGFCWDHCAKEQWKSDARAGINAIQITDDMLRAAVKAMIPERIVGFSTPLNESRTKWGAPHYVEDVRLRKELWRGDDAEELRVRCEMERMRLALNAALGDANA
jgi:hypothetical protein